MSAVFGKAVPVEEKPQPILNEAPHMKREGLPPLKVNAPTSGSEYEACFYKRTNSVYGNKDPEQLVGPRNGLSNRFSQGLASGEIASEELKDIEQERRTNILTTFDFFYMFLEKEKAVDHPRFMAGTTDWMLKLD